MKLTYPQQRVLAVLLVILLVLAVLNQVFGWGLVGGFDKKALAIVTLVGVIAVYTVLTGPDGDEGKR